MNKVFVVTYGTTNIADDVTVELFGRVESAIKRYEELKNELLEMEEEPIEFEESESEGLPNMKLDDGSYYYFLSVEEDKIN